MSAHIRRRVSGEAKPSSGGGRRSARVRRLRQNTRMAPFARTTIAAALLVATTADLVCASAAAQASIDVDALANYRLTTEVFERFVLASGRVGEITRKDPAFKDAPLFTKDVTLSDDAVAAVKVLEARLGQHAGVAAAVKAAKMTPREYATFAIALVAARLAHGFLKAGVLRRVPAGAPTANVEFVEAHESDVIQTLAYLGIRD